MIRGRCPKHDVPLILSLNGVYHCGTSGCDWKPKKCTKSTGCEELVIKQNEWDLCYPHLRKKKAIEYNKRTHRSEYGDFKPFDTQTSYPSYKEGRAK